MSDEINLTVSDAVDSINDVLDLSYSSAVDFINDVLDDIIHRTQNLSMELMVAMSFLKEDSNAYTFCKDLLNSIDGHMDRMIATMKEKNDE